MLRSEYLKNDLFSGAFRFTLKRYVSAFKTEYFSRTKQLASAFYDRFFLQIFKLQEEFKSKKFYEDYLCKNIAYLHTNKNYEVSSLKGDGSFRHYYIPNLYLVVLYELYVSRLIRLVQEVIRSSDLKQFLIFDKYFSFAHQINNSWTIKYVDLWQRYLENEKKLVDDHNFYLKTDVKSFYDSISHEKFCKLLSHFLKDYLDQTNYIKYDIDNFLSEFYDILFKVAKYRSKSLPQWLRWSDYLAVLYLWLILFYERESTGLSFKNKSYREIGTNTKMILYSDDILFVGDVKQDVFNNVNKIVRLLYEYGLVINQNKTTDIMESSSYSYLRDIDIKKIKRRNAKELVKLKKYIIDTLKSKNIENVWSPNFKTYFKWSFLLDFTEEEKSELREILKSLYVSNEDLDAQRVTILLLTISVNATLDLFRVTGTNDEAQIWEMEHIFVQFIENFKDLLSDSTLLWILNYFTDKLSDSSNKVKESIMKILKKKWNPVINCFIETENQNFFLPYCVDIKFSGLQNLLSVPTINSSIDWNSEQYEENIIGLKLNNLFGIPLESMNFPKIKNLKIWHWRDEFLYQMAEVVDSLLYHKYRNPNYYMKTWSFIGDFFSLVNQLITILVSLKKEKFLDCHIAFPKQDISNLNVIMVGKETIKKPYKESFYQNDINIDIDDRLFFYYLQKKRANSEHKESQTRIDFSDVSYNISKYENSEIFLNWARRIVETLCSQMTDKLNKFYN